MHDDEDHALGIQNAVRQLLSDVHTSMPGTVVSYDGRRAVVRPTLSKLIADGRVLGAPSIVSVPVVWPTAMGGQCRISMPMQAGDGVLLHFSERSLEAWHDAGGAVPDDPRQYDLSDAIAVPGLNHDGVNVHVNTSDLMIAFGSASIRITKDGNIIIHGAQIQTDTPIVTTAKITASAEITANGIPLSQHLHMGVQTGEGMTGQPVG